MIDLIRQRLDSYNASNAVGEEQAIKEILQEVALYLLWRGGFSKSPRSRAAPACASCISYPAFQKT